MEQTCQYNIEVTCDCPKCHRCGWNPEVERARKEALKTKFGVHKLYRVPFTGYCEVWATSQEEAAEKAEGIDQQFFAHYDFGDPECLVKEDGNELD